MPLVCDFGEERERFVDPGRALSAREVVAREQQVVGDRELREDAMALDHVHEPGPGRLARRGAGHVAPIEAHAAGCRGKQSRDRAQQGRLAGAIGAEQGDDFARIHVQVDAVQHVNLAVAGLERGDGEQRFSHRGRH